MTIPTRAAVYSVGTVLGAKRAFARPRLGYDCSDGLGRRMPCWVLNTERIRAMRDDLEKNRPDQADQDQVDDETADDDKDDEDAGVAEDATEEEEIAP